LIQEIVQLATDGLTPGLTLLFDLSVAESAVRTRRRMAAKHSDRLDSEDVEFHTRVRNAYLEIAKSNPDRVRVIDARGAVQETHEAVMDIVMPFLEAKGLSAKR
jgi:dTMP kinase